MLWVYFACWTLAMLVAGALIGTSVAVALNEPTAVRKEPAPANPSGLTHEPYELPPRPTSEFDGPGRHGHNPGAAIYKARPGL